MAFGIRHAARRRRDDRIYARGHAARLTGITRAIWAEAAAKLGAELHEPSPSVFEFRLHHAAVGVRGQQTGLSSLDAIERSSDKSRAYRLLQDAGLPVPDHVVFGVDDPSEALAFLEAVSASCVVKPVFGAGGEGVVGSIRSATQLHRAVRRAAPVSPELMIEREVAGRHHRMLFLDGELLDVIRRDRPRVVGDGHATIEELIFREYERRIETDGPAGLKRFVVELDCVFMLALQGLELRSVLPDGASATVMSASNFGSPLDCETYRGAVAAELEAEGRRACEALGTRLGGVDVIALHTDGSLASSGGAVLEVNPVPALHHHYAVAEPSAATRVAVPVLRTLLAEAAAQERTGSSHDP